MFFARISVPELARSTTVGIRNSAHDKAAIRRLWNGKRPMTLLLAIAAIFALSTLAFVVMVWRAPLIEDRAATPEPARLTLREPHRTNSRTPIAPA
jgi:hypothetical protein